MAVNHNLGQVISCVAGADLSANQFRIVGEDANGQMVAQVGNGTIPTGVLLNKPAAAGRAARVGARGCIVKCEAGAAITVRQPVQAVAGGRGSAAAAGTVFIAGYAYTAASGSGNIFELEVAPGQYIS